MVNDSRSLNGDLREGISDGTVKKLGPNRGGDTTSKGAQAVMQGLLPSDRYDFSYSTAAAAAIANRVTSL